MTKNQSTDSSARLLKRCCCFLFHKEISQSFLSYLDYLFLFLRPRIFICDCFEFESKHKGLLFANARYTEQIIWNRSSKMSICCKNFISANSLTLGMRSESRASGLKTLISPRLMLAGQFLTPGWKMWVVAILLDTISKNILTQTHARNENHV